MNKNSKIKKKIARDGFFNLEKIICKEFENIEKEFGKKSKKKPKLFKKTTWKKPLNNGGGTYAILKEGLVFDSVGVNFSEVRGKFKKKFKSQVLGANKNPNYWASGISVVAHMKNPKIPAMHFNTRFICTSKSWFGGGMDATPCIKDDHEKNLFHKKIKSTCDQHGRNYYKKYKKWCDKYFYLPHRKETRGIGGIFFDYKKDNWEKDFNFVKDVGICFLNLVKLIIKRKINKSWKVSEKEKQLIKRGRYVEFNLLYDRGTKFGLNTGGNTKAILMSLPPEAKWK